MDAIAFQQKWIGSTLRESSASQPHFNDLIGLQPWMLEGSVEGLPHWRQECVAILTRRLRTGRYLAQIEHVFYTYGSYLAAWIWCN